MTYISPKQREEINFVEQSEAGKRFFRKVKADNTKIVYARALVLFSKFQKRNLDAIVNEYKEDLNSNMFKTFDKWETILEDFALYVKDTGLGSPTVALFHSGAKALLNANVPRSMRLQAKTPEFTTKMIPGVTIEDLREIYAMCNDQERAFIAFLKDSGISSDDAIRLNFGDVKGFEKEDYVHIGLRREKEQVEYETFIGPDAVQALRAYHKIRLQRGEQITDETPIFSSEHKPHGRLDGRSLRTLFARVKKKTGKTISTHRLRKFFETYMALVVRHPIILKYWMGHKIRGRGGDIEARYIIPPTPEQLKLYVESYRNIDLTPKVSAEELSETRIRAELDTMQPEAAKRYLGSLIKRYTCKPNMKRLIEDIRKEFDKKEDGDCPNGEHCGEQYDQIPETQLLSRLREGWQIVHKLANGDLVVKN